VHEDLRPIVQLQFGKAMEEISRQTLAKTQEARAQFAVSTRGAQIISGQHEASLGRIRIAGVEQLAGALLQMWVDIIKERNGHIARPDIEFILGRMGLLTHAQYRNLTKEFAQHHGAVVPLLTQEAEMRMQAVLADARRELEIMVRKHEVLPKKTVEEKATVVNNLNIQNSNIANLNLGSQVGTINAALEAISSGGSKEFAQALKEFTEAVVSQQSLADANKREVVQALTTVAEEAPKKPSERSTGTLKAIMGYIPTAISSASQLTALWEKLGPTIKGYLGV
jgi:hypothetical protein